MSTLAHEEYAQRVGPPRVVKCDINLGYPAKFVWWCRSHEYGFLDRGRSPRNALSDRCPMSRLEEWRQRRWEAACAS
jgi:hypothetical protein